MFPRRRSWAPAALALAIALGAPGCKKAASPPERLAASATAELSDALKVKRPAGGEWFGLYLLGKKVGHLYSHLEVVPESPGVARSINELYFRAEVGTRISERRHREVRTYESKPNGRLLTLVVEQSGDGGEQTLRATNGAKELRVVQVRPDRPDEVRTLPPSAETIEAADQARVALHRNAKQEHFLTDGTDLQSYRLTSTVEPPEERLIAGVRVPVRRVTTISDKEKVPALAAFTADGEAVDIDMGGTMRAVAEPEETAKRLDKVEVFGLTRVVLPRALPEARRLIPGELTLVVEGLPERFHSKGSRQTTRAIGGGRAEITVRAAPPAENKRAKRPVADPSGGAYLEATLAVESSHPEIRALSEEIVGGEKDAYEAAKKITAWVHQNLSRDYGASADRATDVLRQKRGDCTEHALLSVALMRAAGIPAKRADGLVYLMNEDGVPALYWHEWVEAFVGEWTHLDPTFDQPVADATHIAFGEEGSAEITPLIGSLKVLEVR